MEKLGKWPYLAYVVIAIFQGISWMLHLYPQCTYYKGEDTECFMIHHSPSTPIHFSDSLKRCKGHYFLDLRWEKMLSRDLIQFFKRWFAFSHFVQDLATCIGYHSKLLSSQVLHRSTGASTVLAFLPVFTRYRCLWGKPLNMGSLLHKKNVVG